MIGSAMKRKISVFILAVLFATMLWSPNTWAISTIPNGNGVSQSARVEPNPLGENVTAKVYGDDLPAFFTAYGGAFDGRYIWFGDMGLTGRIVRFDPVTATSATYNLPSGITSGFIGTVFDGQNIWFIPNTGGKLVKVDKDTGTATGYDGWPAGASPSHFMGGAFDGQYLWLAPSGNGSSIVVRVKVSDGTMTGYPLPVGVAGSFFGAVYDEQNVWLIPNGGNALVRINPADGTMTTHSNWPADFTTTGSFSGGIFDGEYIWLIPAGADRIIRLDPATNTMTGYNNWPDGFNKAQNMYFSGAFDGQNIWFTPFIGGQMLKLDKATGEMKSYDISGCSNPNYFGTVFDGQQLWLTSPSALSAALTRVSTAGPGSDTGAPVVANGTLTPSSLTFSSAGLSWAKATDDITPDCKLEYLVYRSDSPNISTVSDMETNGTAEGAFAADIATKTVTGLTPGSTYYFNVMVKDQSGNKTAYTMVPVTLPAPTVTLSYNGNGHTGGTEPVDGSAYSNGQSASVAGNSGSLVKEGSVFRGWNTSADGSGTDYAPGSALTMGLANVTLYAKWELLSSEARLGSLALSGVTLSPAFHSDTAAYSASVGYDTRSTTVTATVYSQQSSASLELNDGIVLTSGQASGPVSLAVGKNTVNVKVTAEDGQTQLTYTVEITREEESAASPETGSGPGPVVSVPPKEDGFRVIINGQPQEQIATAVKESANGQSKLVVTVDVDKLTAQLAREGDKPTVIIPVSSGEDIVSAVLSGAAVQAMENKQAVLDIQTPLGSYTLPAAEVFIGRLSEQVGQVQLADMEVRVEIGKSGEAAAALMSEAASKGGYVLSAPPVDFTVSVSYKGTTLTIEKFSTYVKREIALPEGADANKVTTALVLHADGTTHHVPTFVTSREGKSYAVINSLTNSTYSLVWSPKTFGDMEGHWAKAAVTDMASRFVVNGKSASSFAPDAVITRAEFAAIVVRALGLSDTGETAAFQDVSDKDWYAGSAAKAKEYGLIDGYEDGTFRPDRSITRQEAIVILSRAMKLAGLETSVSAGQADAVLAAFADRQELADWAKEAAAAMVRGGLVAGDGTGLTPSADITRAETTTMVQRVLKAAKLID
ncbi:S-layer homology domain-containing protein [Paenibacillus oceani]|uniref:S-layer homology domain-containing protein n=1 Tax=Paenibacillus oceani TaxID=2772510 RepID=A0A927H0J5_9BACL|nr:S-layer homology domain-containing protein [Paenibacillus oceani]MBD2862549.1 S-layer homology domain-containing protein [Paenibacillus oceani]